MSNDETLRFTVSLPQSLFEEIEADIEARGYQSRSEYIRDLFRDRIVDKQWNNSLEDVVGVLTCLLYTSPSPRD